MFAPRTLPATLSVIAVSILAALPVQAKASEQELMARLDQLQAELQQLKAELAASKAKTEEVAKRQADSASSNSEGHATVNPTVVSSYGEIAYTRPSQGNSQVDVARAVIGITHRFDDKTKVVSEFEWEHAVSSAGDKGETEVEQLYVEREFNRGLQGKAGLFLIPMGLLNTSHEPPSYFGVKRNRVETSIIPTTWREVGLGLSQTLDNGLTWEAGVTTGFDLSKWDATSDEGKEGPLASIHQEGQLAKGHDASLYAALNWRGVPGLLIGGAVFGGKTAQGTNGLSANNARLTLWDLHARYTPGKWDLSALYARGTLSGTSAFNSTLASGSTPIPASFYGWYGQAAYHLWQSGDYRLVPFMRYERVNTGASYDGLANGFEDAGSRQSIVTLGASLHIGEGVVLKADYQRLRDDAAGNSFNLGVGYAF